MSPCSDIHKRLYIYRWLDGQCPTYCQTQSTTEANGTWRSTWSLSMACSPKSASQRLSLASQGNYWFLTPFLMTFLTILSSIPQLPLEQHLEVKVARVRSQLEVVHRQGQHRQPAQGADRRHDGRGVQVNSRMLHEVHSNPVNYP